MRLRIKALRFAHASPIVDIVRVSSERFAITSNGWPSSSSNPSVTFGENMD
eukprot:m.160455 g.160455  ORF g.160455 m.160455 type:complete len:51 (-) comp53027_c0_seq14:1343-1495(-)